MTIGAFQKLKNNEKIAAITAYDALFASIFDGEVDVILVGDSLSMSFGGNSDTIPLSIDSMIYHAKAVRKAISKSLLIVDMPFGSYNTLESGLKNATRIYKESGADALKLEVNESKIPLIEALSNNGIAVMAHIGLMPQFFRFEGYKIKGRSDEEKKCLLELALSFEKAGAFSVLMEGVKRDIAGEITQKLRVPTIGIGSGNACDGQILVWSDMLGFYDKLSPKFVRKYLDGKNLIKDALARYRSDIKSGNFPNEDESY